MFALLVTFLRITAAVVGVILNLAVFLRPKWAWWRAARYGAFRMRVITVICGTLACALGRPLPA